MDGDANNKKTVQCNWRCAACGLQRKRGNPNRLLLTQDSAGPNGARMYRARASPQGICDNIGCSLKLLANLQPAGQQRLAHTVSEALQASSRQHLSDELRKFIEVDTKEAVNVGELMCGPAVKKLAKPAFDEETFLDAHVREGA